MGIIRKTMSASTMGVINWRNDSEREAAAERSKTKAYKQRTKAMKAEHQAAREERQADAEYADFLRWKEQQK